ncbi:MAG: ATPase [Alphaproteobacteria bacterium]|nr:ATPase [Alphaproteobacteria bacterium]
MSMAARRKYKEAAVAEAEGGFAITLDGKGLRTPAGTPLVLPGRALAQAIACEWAAQGTDIQPHTMPFTQYASTALDRVARFRAAILDEMIRHAATELLCYRAEDRVLAERQEALWQPILDWADLRWNAPLAVTVGVMPVIQSPLSLGRLRGPLEAMDDFALSAAQGLTAALGSLVLALAVCERRLSAIDAFDAARLDEAFQNERWGEDYEAIDRRDALRRDVLVAADFLRLHREQSAA